MVRVFLSLGSNMDDRRRNMEEMLARVTGVLLPPIKISRLMETEPVEVAEKQEWYLNQIVSGFFSTAALDLLHECQQIEYALGRVRTSWHGPRTADIDILIFGDAIIRESSLRIPHPGLFQRRFCLEGIREIAPELTIPGGKVSMSVLYESADQTIKEQKIRFVE
jgi:2-amino-4-hydroxy-6-hydroxymethyldihydropteridine diphosphokinase